MELADPSHQHAFPCQQCGSQLIYEPGSVELHCQHCGHQHRIAVSQQAIYEYDYYATLNQLPKAAPSTLKQTVKCEACSAEFEFDKNIHADHCPFCGTAVVVDAQAHQIISAKSLLCHSGAHSLRGGKSPDFPLPG